ncbi:hypothetical protein [Agromyces larvae]|uniref:Uncharacterized protein n=1 Tax=Agromyces larvae TaxID=2929802 RepID=A0ABY4C3I2_9MICO|nr:hypothetical protein [Agromyces larvae]UOE45918.1 hypothetical protein MTO99_09315 [Agromyces larvae]
MTVCDLCDGIIPKAKPDEMGSITHGFIAHKVTERTKWSGPRRTGSAG